LTLLIEHRILDAPKEGTMQWSTLAILVTLTTVLECNPLLQAYKCIKEKRSDQIAPWTFVMIMSIGGLWFAYALTINNLPLIVGNAIKLFSSAVVLVVWYAYRRTPA
jgi:uncharacterized protein with PQ loop repeat